MASLLAGAVAGPRSRLAIAVTTRIPEPAGQPAPLARLFRRGDKRAAVPDPDKLVALFATLGLDRTSHVASPDSTLRPGDLERVSPDATVRGGARRGAMERPTTTEPFLPTITLGERRDGGASEPASADLVLGARLGEGGMGIVDAASQRSLGREVALKRPHGEGGGAALVSEARTMALVEHPNVVPVFALGRDASDRPVLVMKRIQGASLKELLRDRSHAAWPRLEQRWGDQERAALGILGEVCDALTLAHSHGIVHRDVKPENVMVGEFGEVYLLDWGIAHRVGEARGEAGQIVGTPGFMAPEMVLDPDAADARTDVYLLGATLHALLTGKVRHVGESFFETLASALASEPVAYTSDVSEDLAALANAATSLDPTARPASAAAFRKALIEHERHIEAMGLVRAAREALESVVDLGGPEALGALSEAAASIRAAERARPGSDVVRAVKEAHVRALIEREILLESPRAARAHLAGLVTADTSLLARIEALEQKQLEAKARDEAAEKARSDADSWTSVRARVIASFVVCTIFGAFVAQHTFVPAERFSAHGFLRNDLVALAAMVLSVIVGRRALLGNAGNRRLTGVAFGALATITTFNGVSVILEVAPAPALIYGYLGVSAFFAMTAMTVHTAFALPAVISSIGAACLLLVPERAPLISLSTTLAMMAAIFYGAVRTMRASRAVQSG